MTQARDQFGLDVAYPLQGTLLAFDFGMKRIGVAVGQTLTATARPLAPLMARDGIPQWEHIAALIAQWRPQALVVGMPLNMDGTEQTITQAAKRFGRRLKHFYQLPVFAMDERLTTVSARQELFERGGYKLLKKTSVDSIAAQLILESWLRTYGHCES